MFIIGYCLIYTIINIIHLIFIFNMMRSELINYFLTKYLNRMDVENNIIKQD